MLKQKRFAVLVSGGGTNLQALIDAQKNNQFYGKIVAVISSSPRAYAIERAKQNQIPAYIAAKADFETAEDRDRFIADILKRHQADFVVAAGYLGTITQVLLNNYPNKIINIHPSLLPKYGGKGMFGIEPHKAAIANGEEYGGATVHFVNEGMDTGPIIMQERVKILQGDTAESLQARVLSEVEHKILTKCVALMCEDKIQVIGNKVIIN